MVKVHRTEGVANHSGPESCADTREGVQRSVDRGTHRPAIEPRKWFFVPYADTVFDVEGNTDGRANASVLLDGVV